MTHDEIHDLLAAAIRSEMGDDSWDARDADDLASALMAHAIPLIIAEVQGEATEVAPKRRGRYFNRLTRSWFCEEDGSRWPCRDANGTGADQ